MQLGELGPVPTDELVDGGDPLLGEGAGSGGADAGDVADG